jgi:hypothetical protein
VIFEGFDVIVGFGPSRRIVVWIFADAKYRKDRLQKVTDNTWSTKCFIPRISMGTNVRDKMNSVLEPFLILPIGRRNRSRPRAIMCLKMPETARPILPSRNVFATSTSAEPEGPPKEPFSFRQPLAAASIMSAG